MSDLTYALDNLADALQSADDDLSTYQCELEQALNDCEDARSRISDRLEELRRVQDLLNDLDLEDGAPDFHFRLDYDFDR